MKWISRKHLIYPNKEQKKIIDNLLSQLSQNNTYEFQNNNNIFFLDEYHEYIRVPIIGDIRISDSYTKITPNIFRIKLFKEECLDSSGREEIITDNKYYFIIDYIINKDDEILITILTNIHRKKKEEITLQDIDKIYNQNINNLESEIDKIKKKMDRLSTHTPYYWKMQKQLSKKEMKLMNAKMNKYEDMLQIEKNNKIQQNNLLSLIPNNSSSISTVPIIENTQNNNKIEIVFIDHERKYRNI